MVFMKTVLGYLIFIVLLALCYIEKNNAQAVKKVHRTPERRHESAQGRTLQVTQAAVTGGGSKKHPVLAYRY
jgi:hypothetical protein